MADVGQIGSTNLVDSLVACKITGYYLGPYNSNPLLVDRLSKVSPVPLWSGSVSPIPVNNPKVDGIPYISKLAVNQDSNTILPRIDPLDTSSIRYRLADSLESKVVGSAPNGSPITYTSLYSVTYGIVDWIVNGKPFGRDFSYVAVRKTIDDVGAVPIKIPSLSISIRYTPVAPRIRLAVVDEFRYNLGSFGPPNSLPLASAVAHGTKTVTYPKRVHSITTVV